MNRAEILRRAGTALRMLGLFIVLPLLVGGFLGPAGAGLAATTGTMLMLISAMTNGRRNALRSMPWTVLACFAGALTTQAWPWVFVMAFFAFAAGLATLRGAGVAASMACLVAATIPPVDGLGQALVMTTYVILGAAYGWFMSAQLGAPPITPAPIPSRRYAVTLAVAYSLAAGLAAAIAVATGWERSTWLVAAVVVLGIPTPGLTQKLMGQRMLGQLAACLVVLLVSLITNSPWALAVLAMLALVVYLMILDKPLWIQVSTMSAFYMLPAVAQDSGALVAAQRLAYNLLGLGLLLLVLLVLALLRERHPTRAPAQPAG